MPRRIFAPVLLMAALVPCLGAADELTKVVQQDLATLGYDPGTFDGEATTQTAVAISRFQAANDLEVTGAVTPQLAGVIKATIKHKNSPAAGTDAASTPSPSQNPAALKAAQQKCLQDKAAEKQAASKKKRGMQSLVRAVSRTVSRMGGDTAHEIAQASHDVFRVNATAADLQAAARDLGLTPDEVEQCRNPG